MPIMRCQIKGKSGWKFGKSGKCYTGPQGKAKAAAQGRAIKARQSDVIDGVNNAIEDTIQINADDPVKRKMLKESEIKKDSLESRQQFKAITGNESNRTIKKAP